MRTNIKGTMVLSSPLKAIKCLQIELIRHDLQSEFDQKEKQTMLALIYCWPSVYMVNNALMHCQSIFFRH